MDTIKNTKDQAVDYEKKALRAYKLGNFLEAAQWYLKAENFEKAAQLFEIEKKHEKAAECYFKNQEYIEAADNYKKASKEELAGEMLELAREFNKAADIAYKFKKFQQAGELFERAGDYFKAGEAYFFSRDYENALSNLELIKENDPDYLNALSKIAEIFLNLNNPNQVILRIEEFLEGKEIDRFNINCYFALARAYEDLRNFKKARNLYMKISAFDPTDHETNQKLIALRHLVKEAMDVGNSERYKKNEIIGRGGMGIVYHAEDLNLHRIVALKILDIKNVTDDSDIERFKAEAHKVAKLNHPNIVTIYDLGKLENDYFISMEFIEGKDLEIIIKEKHPISITDILMIAKKLFTALDYSHQKGIIHRDIKPNNIMITFDNDAKLVDFGIAVLREELRKKDRDVIAGAPCYMSPEQIEGRTLDHRTDIYSAGVTLFQMVTGGVPYRGSFQEIFQQHQEKPVPSIKELRGDTPGQLVQIIEICMAKAQEKRYQQARQVVKELERVRDINGKPFITYRSGLGIFKKPDDTNALEEENIETIMINPKTNLKK